MNKEQKKFKQVIKQRRKSQRRKAHDQREKLFNKLSPAARAKVLYDRRHAKDEAKKKKEAIRKELGFKEKTK